MTFPPRGAAAGLLAVAMAAGAAWAAPRLHTITIDKLTFAPAPVHLHAGDKVVWINHDLFQHSATADDKSFDVDLKPGERGQIVLRKPGVYSYFCKYHPGMRGRLVVTK